MATSFTIRTAKETGFATLFVRVQRPESHTNLMLSTHLQVDIHRWKESLTNATKLKNYRNSEVDLWRKLDEIREKLDACSKNGLSSEDAKEYIRKIIYREHIAEMEKREAERKAKEDENSLVDYYVTFVQDAESGKAKRIGKGKGGKLGHRTIINYKQGLSWLLEYQQNVLDGKGISFQDINQSFFNDYQDYLEKRTLQRGKYKGEKGCSHNTVAMRLAELKTVLKRAEKDGMKVNSNYASIDIPEDADVDSIALTRSEIDAIKAVDLSNYPKCYEYARDIFLVGIWTAQRVSDYNGNKPGEGIRPEDVKIIRQWVVRDIEGKKVAQEEEVVYIDIRQKKTKNRVQIPVNAELKKILHKYGNNLPFVWPQKLNEYIKEIARKAGITQKERISFTRGGEAKEGYIERCELVHTHTARKTGATLMYNEGVDLYDIMKITGHNSLDTLKKYIKATSGETACRIANKYAYFR